jgi:hypothetical protein
MHLARLSERGWDTNPERYHNHMKNTRRVHKSLSRIFPIFMGRFRGKAAGCMKI